MTTVPRTIKVPLVLLSNEEWIELRKLAFECARFGNHMLNASYVKAKGGPKLDAYKESNGDLSAAIRDAIGRECVGIWRRLGKKILRGDMQLARFTVNRAICIRDRGVKVQRLSPGDYQITLRLLPKSEGDVHQFAVWPNALKRDWFLQSTLDKIVAGAYPLTKASIQFERPGRKVYIRLSFDKPVEEYEATGRVAKCLLDDAGLIYIVSDGQALSLGAETHRIRHMKEHFAGIHDRLRRCLGKPGKRHKHRQALVKAGTFEAWCEGPLHQMSAAITKWCAERRVSKVEWAIPEESGLPSARLRGLCEYKLAERGCKVEVSQTEASDAQE